MAARNGPRELRLGESMEYLVPFGSASRNASLETTQTLPCLFECLASPREVKAQPLPPGYGVCVEARSGHGRHPAFFDEVACKAYVVLIAERRDVGHHVVGAPRRKGLESRGFQGGHQQSSASRVVLGQFHVVGVRQG